jgi:hypothetical protein
MPLPATFWACLAARVLVGAGCSRWPAVALYAACAAFCDVFRAVLLVLPDDPVVVFVDVLFFVLPSLVLARACGASELRSSLILLAIPAALLAGVENPELRQRILPFAVAAAQGASAALGVVMEIRAERPSWERRAAVVLAAVGVFGSKLIDVWADVAAAGTAAYAFVLLAYCFHRLRENRRNGRGVPGSAVDVAPPGAESSPCAEEVAQAEDRPDARREDPGVEGRPEHPVHPPE